jgi:hypothetical protein
VPELSGLAPEITLARGLDQLRWSKAALPPPNPNRTGFTGTLPGNAQNYVGVIHEMSDWKNHRNRKISPPTKTIGVKNPQPA